MACHGGTGSIYYFTSYRRNVESPSQKIIVEGVETQEMVDVLTEMHCDYLQGYLYSKPLPEEDYIAFLNTPFHS